MLVCALMWPTTRYGWPPGDLTGAFQVTTCTRRPLTVCVLEVALFAAAPFRKPHGVIQISSCCAHWVLVGVMTWLNAPCTAGVPCGGAAHVTAVARDAGAFRSMVRR